MARYIEIDEKKVKELKREAQQFQDDITCAIGTDFMQKIAEAENKMIFDILKGLENAPAEDVVPRSEVEELQREYDSLAKTVISSTELIRKLKGKADKAKQEVAKQIFEEIEKHILNETTKSRTIIKDGVNRCFSDYLEGQLVMLNKIPDWIAELKKKYIGENSNV